MTYSLSFQELLNQKSRDFDFYKNFAEIRNLKISNKNLNLTQMSISILRNFTVEPLEQLLLVEAFILGINLKIDFDSYDTIMETTYNPSPNVQTADAIVILQILETLSPILSSKFAESSPELIVRERNRIIENFKMYVSNLKKRSASLIILNTFPIPTYPALGLADGTMPLGQIETILSLNAEILALYKNDSQVAVFDLFQSINRIGSLNGFDPRMWRVAKNPFSFSGMSEISNDLIRLINTRFFTRKKCLILDCDNVLWNGILGEGGVKSLFLEVQRIAIDLHKTGVLLAIASKNNQEDVLKFLEQEQEMLLKSHHLSAVEVNWNNKAENIEKIASKLNIGLDSIVFVDDNEFECNLVRRMLPDVKVIKFDGNEFGLRRNLVRQGLFDVHRLTQEDKLRTQMYYESAQRSLVLESSLTFEDYLISLEIVVEIGQVSDDEIPRVAQLTQKTNQFNLTTRRYTESEIANFAKKKGVYVLFLKASDKISELGLVGVSILKAKEKTLEIDSLLLSCRALGRGIESAFIGVIKDFAVAAGFEELCGKYLETKKNSQVSNFYRDHGFESQKNGGSEVFTCDLQKYDPVTPNWIKIVTLFSEG
jgi:FkbH-like protein